MMIENSSVIQVRDGGRVDLMLIFGKILTLHKVQYISKVRKNLISSSSLIRDDYKMIFESNKIILTKNHIFIGRDYCIWWIT